jgi:hypothetical protein
MNTLFRSLRTENGDLRGLTGSGEPGMHTLLGGTGQERDASGVALASGGGSSTGYAKLAQAHHDVRVAGGAAAQAARLGGYAGTYNPNRIGPSREQAR